MNSHTLRKRQQLRLLKEIIVKQKMTATLSIGRDKASLFASIQCITGLINTCTGFMSFPNHFAHVH